MRFEAYVGASTALAGGVVVSAFTQRPNFYSAAVYVSQSNACLLILTNFSLLLTALVVYGLQKVFYGPLRASETEQLYEKAWFAVTETCLAMTIFRDEFGAWFLVMFVSLLVGKVWSWIGEGRVEVLEQQPPTNWRLFHSRLVISLWVSLIFDLGMLRFTVHTVLRMAKPNMMLVFAFEFAILSINSITMSMKYALWAVERFIINQQTQLRIEARRQELLAARELVRQDNPDAALETGEVEVDEMDIEVPGWDDKGQYTFAIDIATDFLKLVVYLSFFVILLFFYGLPIHIIRDVFLTFRSFFKRIRDFVRYRKATNDMDRRYLNATPEEVANAELCIICRDEMRPWQPDAAQRQPSMDLRSHPKKLPCGHILHFGCLRSWLERQQVCPTCRRPVVDIASRSPPRLPVNGLPQLGQAGANPLAVPAPGAPGPPPPAPGQIPRQPQLQERFLNLGRIRIGMAYGRLPAAANQPGYAGVGPTPTIDPRVATQAQQSQAQLADQSASVPGAVVSRTSQRIRLGLRIMEEEILSEMRNLDLARAELHVLQQAQETLDLLRQSAANAAATVPVDGTPNLPPAASSTAPIRHDDPQLPPGLQIPPGWTVIPLQPAGTAPNGSVPMPPSGPEVPHAVAIPSAVDEEDGKGKSAVRDPPAGAQSSSTMPSDTTATGAEPVEENQSATFRQARVEREGSEE